MHHRPKGSMALAGVLTEFWRLVTGQCGCDEDHCNWVLHGSMDMPPFKTKRWHIHTPFDVMHIEGQKALSVAIELCGV